MKLKNINLLACAALLFTAVSCSDDIESGANTEGGVPISVSAGLSSLAAPETLAGDNSWAKNDVIGLIMLNKAGTEVVSNAFNYKYHTPSGTVNFVPQSVENTAYFPQDGTEVKIKGYYPYSATLAKNMKIPVTVADQKTLPLIDFMSADHAAGFSKSDASVLLNFHHRLSKLIFNISITDDDKTIPLKDFVLTIKGMNTKANYDLSAEKLIVDAASAKDIAVPLRGKDTERDGIVLPRTAAAGISFEFKAPNGSVYTAKMSPSLALEGGYKYTFNIKLQKTPVTISATVEEWLDGPTSNYEAFDVSTPAGASSGVKAGDIMKVYMKSGADYALLKPFTFNADGKWYAQSPVYWEDIVSPAVLRSSIIAAKELNPTQLADILISDEISVQRNTGANFELKHAASKVAVKLVSTTFSTTDLEGATITLPNYKTGGKELNGAFVEGTQVANISVDRTDKNSAIALFQPQTIEKGKSIATVTLAGRDYQATIAGADHVFKAGEAQILTITINKTETSVSAKVVDWDNVNIALDAITIGTSTSGAVGVLDNEKMIVYTGDATTRTELSTFTYKKAGNLFTPTAPVYWESIVSPSTFYASILRMAKYNATQLDDHLIAKPLAVTASNGVKFELSHPASKLIFQLTSSDGTFTTADLEAMTITLPAYANGATIDKGVFVAGTSTGDVTVAKNVGDDSKSAIAIVQPQDIASGTIIADIIDPKTSRSYKATSTSSVSFKAGVATVLKIDLKKVAVSVSANVIDWVAGDDVSLVPPAFTIGGTLDNTAKFFENKKIEVYKHAPSFASFTYSYLPEGAGFAWSGAPMYWDDQQVMPYKVTAIHYPSESMKPAVQSEATQFAWNLPANQSKGYANYDILTSFVTLTAPQYVNFKFAHVMSKVKVELSSDEFTATQLLGAKISLKNFILNGTVKVVDGKAVTGTGVKDVVPYVETDGSKYSALVMTQTLKANTDVVVVTLSDYPNTPFTGQITSALNFEAGKETVIKLKLKRTSIELSATLEAWTPGDTGSITIQ